ncbi:MAG TPA: hypothetical protein VJ927_02555 [Actinomycetota bacterium]|nr:hypothetical protein [Actinomycetota bacterium]
MGLAPASLGDTSRIRASGSCTEDPHWEPSRRTIVRGDRIVWRNPTSCDHTVTAYGGGWSKSTGLPPGGSTAKRFRRTGTFKFRCLTRGHSVLENGVCNGMCGRVRVTG